MKDDPTYLGWAWPRHWEPEQQHYFPRGSDVSICLRVRFACEDRHENPTEPCPECRRVLDALVEITRDQAA